jgi:hypothetical protein
VSSHRQQAHLEAPIETIWSLVGTPNRYPEWWPRVIEVQGERFEEGDEWAQVTTDPRGHEQETKFLLERREELREIRMSCQKTGAFAHWQLTEAQGGTFVDLEMGMQPKAITYRLYDVALGRRYFRRWSEESLRGLEDAAARERETQAR